MTAKKITSRQQKALETKKALFNSAVKLFKTRGYYKVSVDEIVKEAGTSKGSFYTHFTSKDQIMLEQFKRYDEHYLKVYDRIISANHTATEKLIAFVKESYIYTTNEVGLEIIKVVYQTQLSYDKEKTFVIDESRPLYKILNNIIEEGQNTGEFRKDISSEELTRIAVRCMRGTFYDWCLYDGKFDIIANGTALFSIFVQGIKNTKP